METEVIHSVDLLEKALKLAKKQGITIREEATPNGSNGLCRVGSQFYLFLDPSLPASQQLVEVMSALAIKAGKVLELAT